DELRSAQRPRQVEVVVHVVDPGVRRRVRAAQDALDDRSARRVADDGDGADLILLVMPQEVDERPEPLLIVQNGSARARLDVERYAEDHPLGRIEAVVRVRDLGGARQLAEAWVYRWSHGVANPG